MNDLRFAVRQLLKSPGFTLVAVLSLALGIGATATVLCWMRHLVLQPLAGVADQEELVMLVSNQGGGNVSVPDLQDFVAQSGVFAGALVSMPSHASLSVDHQAGWINAQIISANAFDLLGVKPILGRAFRPEEDRTPGGNPVLIISERLWRRRFKGDAGVIGRVVDLNRHAFTIIGVAPASFPGTMAPSITDAWAPSSMIWEVRNQATGFLDQRPWRGWLNLARLRPGVSLAEARAAVESVNARLTADHPDTNRDIHHRVVPLAECPWSAATIVGPVFRLLLVVCAGVLLIVAANVANLLLARAVGRRKEIAIRLAAGASRARLLRQLLIESLVLAVLGGAGGVLLAGWMIDALPFLLPEPAPDLVLDFSLDGMVIGLVVALTLGTGVLFGLLPAWQASRADVNEALKESGRGSSGGAASHRARRLLVVAEVALALVLLAGAGLCLKGLARARQLDLGFNPDHVLTAGLQIGMNGYTRETGPAFYRQLRDRLATLPGVEHAALASWFPLGLAGCKGTGVRVDGYTRPAGEDATYEYAIVSPSYFAAMRISLLAGRDFTDQDDASSPGVAIVNEAFARRFWPGQDPIGRKFRSGGRERTIVGLARTGRYNRLDEPASCFLYLPYQQGVPDLDLELCVRFKAPQPGQGGAGSDAAAFAKDLRRTVAQLDPGVDLVDVRPLRARLEAIFFAQRMASLLLTLLGVLALTLASMGVYAVMACMVGQRTQEFGVRLALGAAPRQVLWLVLRQGLGLAAAGIAGGLLLTAAVTRLLASFLHGVHPLDPVVLGAVALLLVVVALIACWLPARRATLVDPMVALRAE
ncbi:MAG TPA: ABC transporter permease [Lacunisphaera sp.]|nr:ABC transporter permease [Lacunisphaera sp.]